MKNYIIYFILVYVLTSCATKPADINGITTDNQKIISLTDSVNEKVYGDFSLSSSLESSNLEIYVKKIQSLKNSNAKEYLSELNDFDQKIYFADNTTFIICLFSVKREFALCDEASKRGIEYSGNSKDQSVIDKWMQDLKSKLKQDQNTPLTLNSLQLKKQSTPPDSFWLENKYYKTLYSKNHNIAYYSEYTVTKEELCAKKAKRRDNFHGDIKLKSMGLPMPLKGWYIQPWDRGHLAPAEDFSRSQDAIDTTFLMSNMTPQKDKFNRVAWRLLEEEVRGWGINEGKIKVLTGPILEPKLETLKKHPVSIPKRHFKAVLDLTPPKKMIGFIMPQTDSKAQDFKNRVVSVREIEKEVGMNLFDESDELEGKSDLSEWKTDKCN